MKILQRNLSRSTFVVWEMKRNVSVVRFKFRCNILISGIIIKEMPVSVGSGTHCITMHGPQKVKFPVLFISWRTVLSSYVGTILLFYSVYRFLNKSKELLCVCVTHVRFWTHISARVSNFMEHIESPSTLLVSACEQHVRNCFY